VSCPIAKAERSKAKDARQQLAPDKAVGQPSTKDKRAKPYKIEAKWPDERWNLYWGKEGRVNTWHTYATYAKQEVAERAMEGFRRKYGSFREFRLTAQPAREGSET
jgi:hypothetical protein